MAGHRKRVDRRRIGGDVYLTTSVGGSPANPTETELRIDVGFEVPDWKAASKSSLTRAAFPGTALKIAGRWYEISGIERPLGGPRRVHYPLRPWDDAAVIRTVFELTPEASAALTSRHRETERRQRRGELLGLLPFLTGLLPGKDQQHLERTYGISGIAATWISAGLLLSFSTLGLLLAYASSQGMAFGELEGLVRKIAAWMPLSAYLFFESLARLMSVSAHQPMGSFPVVLGAQIYHGLHRLVAAPRTSSHTTSEPRDRRGMLTARDQVRPLAGPREDLEILSRLPKDHWTANVTGIEIEGTAYVLIEREVIETDDGPRHRFLLRRPEHDVLFNSYLRYHPEEVRDVYRAQQRLRAAMWVESLPFLWGLLEACQQDRLAAIYNYEPYRWTRWTVVASLLLGLGLGFKSTGQMLAGTAGAGDAGSLILATVLLLEGGLRWTSLQEGRIRGSLWGFAVEPLAARFLKWE